jgi:hypothetical protein
VAGVAILSQQGLNGILKSGTSRSREGQNRH